MVSRARCKLDTRCSYSHTNEAGLSVSPKAQSNSEALVAAGVVGMEKASRMWRVFLGQAQWAVLKTMLTSAVS